MTKNTTKILILAAAMLCSGSLFGNYSESGYSYIEVYNDTQGPIEFQVSGASPAMVPGNSMREVDLRAGTPPSFSISWNALDVQYSPIQLIRPERIRIKKDGECVIYDSANPSDRRMRERTVKTSPKK